VCGLLAKPINQVSAFCPNDRAKVMNLKNVVLESETIYVPRKLGEPTHPSILSKIISDAP